MLCDSQDQTLHSVDVQKIGEFALYAKVMCHWLKYKHCLYFNGLAQRTPSLCVAKGILHLPKCHYLDFKLAIGKVCNNILCQETLAAIHTFRSVQTRAKN